MVLVLEERGQDLELEERGQDHESVLVLWLVQVKGCFWCSVQGFVKGNEEGVVVGRSLEVEG